MAGSASPSRDPGGYRLPLRERAGLPCGLLTPAKTRSWWPAKATRRAAASRNLIRRKRRARRRSYLFRLSAPSGPTH